LEGAVQSKAATLAGRDTLYVVSGTLYENAAFAPSNDGGQVARPSHFYKLLMLCSFNSSGEITGASGAAYVYTNEAHSKAKLTDPEFKTTIDAIEQRAGFDFFPRVPADLQEAAESVFSNIL
jgi:DNA/RNA endonuclease G (NUC1)